MRSEVAPAAPTASTAPPGPTATPPLSAEAFGELTSPFRRELLVHCYRMLGSIDDAEDAVQEAFTRAWNRRATFRRDISFRAWLYRITTNVCLDVIERRKRASGEALLAVQPIPDDLLDEPSAGPEARYAAHESISLAFLTALQLLTPRQRGVLILRDVLSWRAAEVAELLDVSVPAANSALHRARQTLARRYPPVDITTRAAPDRLPGRMRSLLVHYVRAWEAADIPGLVALLREDAVVSMPPGLTIEGASAIGVFLARSVFVDGLRIRLRPVPTNGGSGFVLYSGAATDPALKPYAVLIVEFDRDRDEPRVARMSVFAEPRLIARFAPPEEIPNESSGSR